MNHEKWRGVSIAATLVAGILAAAGAWNNPDIFETILFGAVAALLVVALAAYPPAPRRAPRDVEPDPDLRHS